MSFFLRPLVILLTLATVAAVLGAAGVLAARLALVAVLPFVIYVWLLTAFAARRRTVRRAISDRA